MGARRRVRQTGKAAPSRDVNAAHNRHNGYTWADFAREREAERAARAAQSRDEEADDEEL